MGWSARPCASANASGQMGLDVHLPREVRRNQQMRTSRAYWLSMAGVMSPMRAILTIGVLA